MSSQDSCQRGTLALEEMKFFSLNCTPSLHLCPGTALLCTLSHHRAKPGLDGSSARLGGSPMVFVCGGPCGKRGPAWGPLELLAEPLAGQ